MGVPRTTLAIAAAVGVAAALAGVLPAASTKDRLREKRAQAAAVLAQVNALDRQFEASVEAWNGARYELTVTRRELAADRVRLALAQRARSVAVAELAARVRALYESGDEPTTLGILLGSSSLSDLIDRLNAANAVARADRQLAAQTTAARNRYARAARATEAVAKRRAIALTQRTQERQRIGALLSQRKRLLSSVESEVRKLQAQEAVEQARLAAQARARLAAARRARDAAAARAAAARAAAPVTTTAPSTTTAPTTTAPAPTTTATPPTTATTTTTDTVTDPAPAQAPLGAGHPEAATIALRYLGVPYLWGGASPAGFDCSGLVMYVYAQLGIALPHYAAAQYQLGTAVPPEDLQPGDLVFFDNLNHVGIYIGGGMMVHAPHTGDVVKISPMSTFGTSYVGARRI